MTFPWRRAIAIVTGFVSVAVLSIGADTVMHGASYYPAEPSQMSNGLFAVAATYRAVFTVLGGAITTALSRETTFRPAQILSFLGLLGGLAGVAAWLATPNLGPLWYAATIPISAVPCTLFGAWLVLRRHGQD